MESIALSARGEERAVDHTGSVLTRRRRAAHAAGVSRILWSAAYLPNIRTDTRVSSASLTNCFHGSHAATAASCGLILRPLLEHLRYGVPHRLLVLAAVVAQRIL